MNALYVRSQGAGNFLPNCAGISAAGLNGGSTACRKPCFPISAPRQIAAWPHFYTTIIAMHFVLKPCAGVEELPRNVRMASNTNLAIMEEMAADCTAAGRGLIAAVRHGSSIKDGKKAIAEARRIEDVTTQMLSFAARFA
jgi:hypothetical protein